MAEVKRKKKSPLETAFEKGKKAAMEGRSESDCPYIDIRQLSGKLTFSRAFINAWRDGFRSINK